MQIRLCQDCTHIRRGDSIEFAKCGKTSTTDPVTGETSMTFCTTERRPYEGCCGPEAKFFKQSTQKSAIEIA